MLVTMLTIIFVIVCLVLCVTILLQSSKGGLGAGLGGAQATQVFGGQGAGGFLVKLTIGAASAFMVLSIGLARLSSQPQSILGELDEGEAVSSDEDEIIEAGTLDTLPAAVDVVIPATTPSLVAPPTLIAPPVLEEEEAPVEEEPADPAPAQP